MSSFTDAFARSVAARSVSAPPQYRDEDRKRKLVLKMDVREANTVELLQTLQQQLQLAGLADRLVVERLDLFDFVFAHADDRTRMFGPAFERKTVADLAASIKDDRYREQRARMHALGLPADKIIYIIEGNVLTTRGGINPKSVHGAVLKPVMRGEHQSAVTTDINATCSLLVSWLVYLEHLDEPHSVAHFSYVDGVQSQVRKGDFRDENMLPLMLSEFVRGVSSGVAKAVVAAYPTLAKLQMAFLRDQMGTISRISDLPVEGREMRVGPAVATRIAVFCDISSLRQALTAGPPIPSSAATAAQPLPAKKKRAPRRSFKAPEGKKKKQKVVDDDDDEPEDIDDDE